VRRREGTDDFDGRPPRASDGEFLLLLLLPLILLPMRKKERRKLEHRPLPRKTVVLREKSYCNGERRPIVRKTCFVPSADQSHKADDFRHRGKQKDRKIRKRGRKKESDFLTTVFHIIIIVLVRRR
jgi:hypothetical protein